MPFFSDLMLIRSKAKLAATATDSGKFYSRIALLKQGYINKKIKKIKGCCFWTLDSKSIQQAHITQFIWRAREACFSKLLMRRIAKQPLNMFFHYFFKKQTLFTNNFHRYLDLLASFVIFSFPCNLEVGKGQKAHDEIRWAVALFFVHNYYLFFY